MEEQNTVVVHVASQEADAQIVVGFLQSRGIEAAILEDDAGDQLPSLEMAMGVKVFVPGEDAERARTLLAERETASGED